ncbi:Sporulation kinase A [Sporomusa termitida]|uniref:histidine kinase n=1 Tax=Sporomusa termitida TaxID=2377 RepID=A0A517DY02_9FIRM|nr:Sporulation kinase A [Sporomusa termitida]
MINIYPRANDREAARISRRDLIGLMAVGVAHGIRNPLTVIKGYLQLQDKRAVCCSGESLAIILQELGKIEDFISDIILLAHNKTSKKSPQNLNDIVKKVYPAIQQAAAPNGIAAELVLAERLPLVNLDTAEIEQLIMHLAGNGIEAMGAGGRLTLGTAHEQQEVILYVQDEGRGIPREQKSKIFAPFFTTKATNTGLGLAVSLSILERHQGRITVLSAPGAGSIFKIRFPVGQ